MAQEQLDRRIDDFQNRADALLGGAALEDVEI
jgi:hypothetical protein